ncbi:MAG: hypothetical protein ABII08_02580 [Candidatus Beckwithbacteria bacterium]|nr:PIN domain-containing protein [Patescibacteria group bacterium]
MIFVDSDAFIGLSYRKDVHYKKSKIIMDSLGEQDEILITSWQVVDEVATKLSYFTTKKLSVNFLNWLFESDIKIVYVDEKLSRKIVKKFKSQRSKRVSLTDCTNMVIAKEMRVERFFSFDKVYVQNGFKLL